LICLTRNMKYVYKIFQAAFKNALLQKIILSRN